MSMLDATQEVLTYLFDGYKNENKLYGISTIAKKHQIDNYDLGTYLVDHGWVKNGLHNTSEFFCQITLSGIEEIDTHYVRNK
jgi:hypothetical protein